MKEKIILLILGAIGIAILFMNVYRTGVPTLRTQVSTSTPTHTQTLAAVSYRYAGGMRFEIATTTKAQERGLSGRAVISNNYGMLFIFPTHNRYGFWMKDMLVPIDIIWLSDNGTILGIEHSLSPSTYPKEFYPPSPIEYVLEVRSGLTRARGWSVGTRIPLPLPYGVDVSK